MADRYLLRYHLGHAYIIDVSQSVEHDHPSSFDFLRSDIKNLDDFFKKRSGGEVRTLGIRGTFDFIVNERVTMRGSSDTGPDPMTQTEEELKDVVRNWLDAGVGLQEDSSKPVTRAGGTAPTPSATSLAQDDAVFMSSYIPRNLGEVYDPERDIDRINKGQGEDLIYAGITGLNTQANAKGKADDAPVTKEESKVAESAAERSRRPSVKSVRFEDEQEESESEDSDDDELERRPRGFRHEDKEAKKVRMSNWVLKPALTRRACRSAKRPSRRKTERSGSPRCPRRRSRERSRRARRESSCALCISSWSSPDRSIPQLFQFHAGGRWPSL